jgi:hypothetical protein
MRCRRIAVVLLAVATATIAIAQAEASSPHLADLVGQGPVTWTPNVSAGTTVGQSTCNGAYFGSGTLSCQSEVYGTAYVNGDVVVVGAFTKACQPGTLAQGLCKPGTQVTRNDIFAYRAGTGLIDPSFAPKLDKGPAWTVIPGPAGTNTVYVGGSFTNVNGTTRKGLVQLHVNPGVTTGSDADGLIVTGFKANVSNMVRHLVLSPDGTALYAAGQFVTVNGVAETGLVRVNAKTGAVDRSFNFTLSHPISGLPLKIEAMDLTSNGSLLAFSGTALQVNGQSRPRLAVVATGGTLSKTATLTDFTAPILANGCNTEHDYVRALSFAPDGSFLVVADTGFQSDGSTPYSVCDAAARFNVAGAATITGTPVDVAPSWINYTGGDSFYSVTIAGSVVYAGGHNRWINNQCGADSLCEPNALYQGGLSALDANTGVGLAWWHPITLRGAGTMFLNTFGTNTYDGSHSGLALGTDVDVIAGSYHSENALLPVMAATTKTPFGTIPSGLFNEEGGTDETNAPMCLDDPGNSLSASTRVDIATCVNQAEQNWTVPATGTTGQIKINNLCLDTAGGSTADGAGVILASCTTASTQQWTQGARNTVINKGAAMCLDDPSSSTTNGTALDIATCSGGQNQIWPLPVAPGPATGAPSGPVYPQLTQSNTQQPCLDDANDSTTAGNKVQLWTCRGDAAQTWAVESDRTMRIGASSCLDTSGSNVVLNPCSGGSSQVWAAGANDSLVQQSSGLCLDDPSANTGSGNGTQLRIASCDGQQEQAWRLPGW